MREVKKKMDFLKGTSAMSGPKNWHRSILTSICMGKSRQLWKIEDVWLLLKSETRSLPTISGIEVLRLILAEFFYGVVVRNVTGHWTEKSARNAIVTKHLSAVAAGEIQHHESRSQTCAI
jgi:hypothetical protein